MTPRSLRAWIKRHVPEADTVEKVATLSRGLEQVGHLLLWKNPPTSTAAMTVAALNRQSAEVVKTWDRLIEAMRDHETARVDLRLAGIDLDPLTKVIDRYREALPQPRPGRPRGFQNDLLAQATAEIRNVLGVPERRAATIIAAFAAHEGIAISTSSLRQSVRNRRVSGR